MESNLKGALPILASAFGSSLEFGFASVETLRGLTGIRFKSL